MDNQVKLNDIADDLLIFNKITVDTLFQLDNCADCVALYMFYYKTAKWQKTNTIKAVDLYVKKSLNWGIDRIKRTKQTLKENGLISIVQRRKDGKIDGWYIEVSYLVAKKKLEDIKVKVEESKNTQNQQVENSTSGFEDTNALKQKIKCLEKEIEMLKNKNAHKNGKAQEGKLTNHDAIIDELVEDAKVKETLYEFIKMRTMIKKPLTDKALGLLINRLNSIGKSTEEKVDVLNQSIINNWQNIFPIKTEQQFRKAWQKPEDNRFYKQEPVEDDLPF